MKVALAPYPAYKDSGVPWLGEVPEHWDVRKLKQVFRRIVGGSTPSNAVPSFWDGDVTWITPTDISRTDHLNSSLRKITESGLKSCSSELVPPGSIIVTSRAPVGNIALAEVELCTNQGCKALVATEQVIDPVFGLSVMKTLKTELQSLATGTTFTEISTTKLGIVSIPLPPLDEQAAIVKFLNYVDRRIRRYVGAKKKSIKLLEEQKHAIIHRAVTRGLDPDVRLKPSGVAWLGDVPEHWEVKALKHWVGMNVKVLPETTPPDFQLRYVDIGSVETGLLKNPPRCITFESAPSRARRILRSGDTIVSTVRTYLKAVWLVTADDDALIASTGFAVLTPGSMADPKFVSYTVQSNALMDQIAAESVGTTYPAIAEGRLASSKIAVPPLHEQAAIVRFLDDSTAHIDATISRTKQEISLLSEYRTRLIADVVTGKLDVRKVAANLPDEPIESEQLDEDNVLVVDDDFEGNDDDIDEELEEVEA